MRAFVTYQWWILVLDSLAAVFQYGLKAMLASADGIPLLVRAINPKVPHMMVDAVRLLSAICILEHTENL